MTGTGVQDPEVQALNRWFGVQTAGLPLATWVNQVSVYITYVFASVFSPVKEVLCWYWPQRGVLQENWVDAEFYAQFTLSKI